MSLLKKLHTVAHANSSGLETTQATTIDLFLDFVTQSTGKQNPKYFHTTPQSAIMDNEVTELHEHKEAASRAAGSVSGNNT